MPRECSDEFELAKTISPYFQMMSRASEPCGASFRWPDHRNEAQGRKEDGYAKDADGSMRQGEVSGMRPLQNN